jgi:calcineurin-like phosphoesterase family protein
MDETLIERWNSVVKPTDKIYHLGDVYFPKYKSESDMLFKRLNGTKVLILGNHDAGKDQLLLKYFSRIYSWRFLKEFGLLLTHVPIHESSLSSKLKWNIHGHTHDKGSPEGPYKSVCVELTNYTPVPIEEVV